MFSNSCFYNSTYSNIARKSGYSLSFIKKHVSFFKKHGWVKESDGNMTFLSIRKVERTVEYKCGIKYYFKILKTDTWKDVLKKLRLLIIRQRHDLFHATKKPSSDQKGENEKFKITNAFVGKLNRQSRSSASRLMNWGMANGILWLQSTAKVCHAEYRLERYKNKLRLGYQFYKPKPLNPFIPENKQIFRGLIYIHQEANEVTFL